MLQSFWITIATQALTMLTSGEFVNDVKEIVTSYIEKDIDGSVKRESAISDLREKGYGFASWLVNASIELALGYLKIKYPKLFV